MIPISAIVTIVFLIISIGLLMGLYSSDDKSTRFGIAISLAVFASLTLIGLGFYMRYDFFNLDTAKQLVSELSGR